MRPGSPALRPGDPSKAFAIAALLLATAGAAFAFLDLSLWHPGVDAWDQVKVIALAQEAREGLSIPWRFGGGSLYLQAVRGALAWGGAHPALWRLPNFLAYALESALLWRLANALAGPSAGLGAILFNSLAAFTWLRLRSLLGFVFLPAELLALLCLAQGSGKARSLLLGMGMGLMLFGYEAALMALPVVALWSAVQPRERRPSAAWALLGLSLLLPLLVWGTLHSASNFAAVRLSPNLGRGLGQAVSESLQALGRFISGHGRSDLLLERLPALPPFSLPLLALGLWAAWRSQRALLGWLLLGLAPLAAAAQVAEAHRAIVAWPALALIAGLGLAWLWTELSASRAAIATLLLALAVGGAWEARAYLRMQDRITPQARSHWRLMELAAQTLRQRQARQPIQVLDGLNWRGLSELRSLVHSDATATEAWAVLSPDYALPLDARLGAWQLLQDPLSPGRLYLLQVAPAQVARFERRDHALKNFRATAAPRFDGPGLMRASVAALDGPLGKDPWLRQALLDSYLYTALETGLGPATWGPLLLAQPRLSISQGSLLAQALSDADPHRALTLAESALKADPQRQSTRDLVQRLRSRLAIQH